LVVALAVCAAMPVAVFAAETAAPAEELTGPSWIGYLSAGVLALALNFLFTLAQTSLAAIGPGALAELEDRSKHPIGLTDLPSLEVRLGLACLLMLLTSTFAISRLGALLLPAAPVVGAVVGVTLALFAHLVVVEVFSRGLALQRPLVWAKLLVPASRFLSVPLAPLVVPFRAGEGIRQPGGHPLALADMHLRLLPNLRGVERILDEDAFEMIDSVRDFAETTGDQIMTPRTQVEGIPLGMPADEVYQKLRESEFSRLVVYDGDLDHVVGTLLAKEVLLRRPKDPFQQMRPPIVASEKMRLPELLQLIRANRTHLILIQDEYGGLAGVVTLHDLFERIVGHIEDVDDVEELWIARVDERTLRVNGRVELWEINEELGTALDETVARTIGGYVFNTLGRPARESDTVQVDGLTLTIVTAGDNRVEEVRIELTEAANSPAEEAP
jgi:putative hemolysin